MKHTGDIHNSPLNQVKKEGQIVNMFIEIICRPSVWDSLDQWDDTISLIIIFRTWHE